MKTHPKFKLNGSSCSSIMLKELAFSFIKKEERFKAAIGYFLLAWLSNSKNIIVSTSGSTGKPKEILLSKQQMINSALATGTFFDLNATDTALLCLPCDFIAGKMMLVRAMIIGLELDYVEPNSNPLKNIEKEYNFVAMTPLQTQNSIKKLDLVKQLIIGGAPVGKSLYTKLKTVDTIVYETYGMTETITHIAAKKINHNSAKVEDCFKVLPNVSITKDKRDCLVIDAPKINNKKVITNDLVELVSEKEFKWLGRYDSIINSGGVKLIPEQIEQKLEDLLENRFFVAGIPDETLGEKLILVVEGDIDTDSLFSKFKSLDSLKKFEVPKTVLKTKNFVESANGKVLRLKTIQKLFAS